MSVVDMASTVGNLVLERPGRSKVFQRYQIDFCCGGKRTLAEACRVAGADAAEVLQALLEHDSAEGPPELDWSHASLTELADHIETIHHTFMHRELPRVRMLVDKVASVHGDRHPELLEVRRVYHALRTELEMHLMKEEQVLFPLIRRIDSGEAGSERHCGGVRNPIRVMEHEHDEAGELLRQLRALTNDYQPPADACNSYRAMMDGLLELEKDTHLHIHKENNLLFPRAVEAADTLGNC